MKKMLMAVVAIVLIVVISVSATFAYLTDEEDVLNTFTVGDVQIELDETDVDLYGEKDGETRVKANEYKLLPGHSYIKDPVVTVKADSEDAYVRALVTVSDVAKLAQAFGTGYVADDGVFLLQNLVTGWSNDVWEYVGYENGTYEFRYTKIVESATADQKLPALFKTIEIPGSIDNDNIALLKGVTVTVVAQAIQADGFETAADPVAAAWAAFSA